VREYFEIQGKDSLTEVKHEEHEAREADERVGVGVSAQPLDLRVLCVLRGLSFPCLL
jgi:hypothetical protein